MTYEARINREGFVERLYLMRRGGRKPIGITFDINAEEYDEGLLMPVAAYLDDYDARQMFEAIAQALWDTGWRPKNTHESDSALKRHLHDMRAIVFASLEIEDPEKKR